jgi:hypothetical protein
LERRSNDRTVRRIGKDKDGFGEKRNKVVSLATVCAEAREEAGQVIAEAGFYD